MCPLPALAPNAAYGFWLKAEWRATDVARYAKRVSGRPPSLLLSVTIQNLACVSDETNCNNNSSLTQVLSSLR